MVSLYVAGEKVGTLTEDGKLFAEFIARHVPLEFRDDSGEVVGRYTPIPPAIPPEPPIPWALNNYLGGIGSTDGRTVRQVR